MLNELINYCCSFKISGPLAERWNLRYFLCCGMILSGLFTFGYGIAYWLEIHSLTYFIIIQVSCLNFYFKNRDSKFDTNVFS